MKFTLLCLLSVVCASIASPTAVKSHALVRHRRQLDLDVFRGTRQLIEELVANLGKAAQQARDAVAQFNKGLLEEAKRYREKFLADVQKLRDKISENISMLQDKFSNSGSAVGDCISSHRNDAEAIFNEAQTQTISCAEARIQEGGDLVKGLSTISENGQEIASTAYEEMKECSAQHNGNIFGMGACLGSVAVKTEVKGASFLVQSGLAIGRINLYMSTLPAALEVCAGSSLVSAGIGTARILMDIGSCSTNSVLNNFGINTGSTTTSVSSVTGSLSASASTTVSGLSSTISDAISGGAAANLLR